MIDPTNNPSANFSGFPAGYNPFAAMSQALAYQQPGTPVQMPQMTPQQMSYGPMHSALAEQLAQALQAQMGGGLLGSPTPQSMGLLSTAMTPATPVGMPKTGGDTLPEGSYYRLTPEFWAAMAASKTANKPRFGGAGSYGSRSGGTNLFTNRNGGGSSTQSPYGNAGGGLSDYGQRSLADYGGIF